MTKTWARDHDPRRQERLTLGNRRAAEAQRLRAEKKKKAAARKALIKKKKKARAAKPNASTTEESSSNSDTDDEDAPLKLGGKVQSAKASYMAKVTSAVVGYGSDYELFQFVYDLWLFTTLGSSKNSVAAPMRVALAGRPYSPEYWRTRHAALLDLQRQCGWPSLFITISPYEWTWPYHAWVEDEMVKAERSRTYLPGAETLHISDVMTQAVSGLLTGANKNKDLKKNSWKRHVFGAADGSGRRALTITKQMKQTQKIQNRHAFVRRNRKHGKQQ